VVVGGIYSPNHQSGRWGRRLSKGAPDTVRCASHVTQPLGFDRWSSDMWDHRTVRWCTRQSLFTVRCAFWRCSDSVCSVRALFTHCSLLQTTVGAVSRCSAWHTAQFGATPDSPVNYSGVASRIPEASKLELIHPGALDTVRWHTRHSGAPDQGSSVGFAPFYLNPFLDFFLVCVEPLAPVELII
jgi:hypothetical protein